MRFGGAVGRGAGGKTNGGISPERIVAPSDGSGADRLHRKADLPANNLYIVWIHRVVPAGQVAAPSKKQQTKWEFDAA